MELPIPVALIVVVEFCERLCYYTFQGTQKTWLQDQGYGNAQSSSFTSVFGLLSFVSCFFGGILAETQLGRFKTIAALSLVYAFGCFLAAAAARAGSESVPLYFFGTFVLVAFGTGGIKPNVCTFGADQIDPQDPGAARKTELFFSYFYVTINLGSCVAFGFLATVATNGIGSIQAKDGFYFAYMVAASAMTFAVCVFLGGARYYRKESMEVNSESVIGLWMKCLLSGWVNPMGKMALLGWALIPCVVMAAILNAFVPSWIWPTLALTVLCITCLCVAHYDNTWLGRNEVTRCLDCVPTMLIGNVSFAVLYGTMTTMFYSQSCQMDTRIGRSLDATQLNAAFFNLADCVAVIVFAPFFNNVCLPYAERRLGFVMTLDMKVYAGMMCAICSQLVAAALEQTRLSRRILPIGSMCAPLNPDGSHVVMSELSAFWMCIPYFLIGMGEVLVFPVLQHFTYEQASPSMRSMMQAVNLFAMGGLPGAICSAMNMATARFTPNNLNDGYLPAVYAINVGLAILGCALFYVVRSAPSQYYSTLLEKVPFVDAENRPSTA